MAEDLNQSDKELEQELGLKESEMTKEEYKGKADQLWLEVEGMHLDRAEENEILRALVEGRLADATTLADKAKQTATGEEPPTEAEINFARQEAKDKQQRAEIDKRWKYIQEKYIKDPTDPAVKQEYLHLRRLRGI